MLTRESATQRAVAKAAAGMIGDGRVVIVDGGTTAVELVRQLPRALSATVVTHGPNVAVELAEHPGVVSLAGILLVLTALI
ncbi:hypothetical protein [Trinickia mobilis]|uniref:hypothetical protein n=1 Tax=Trinickia mobilis TaxID=2816356 RepID=UPI001A8F4D57|nr:hypothetical protein [Trinickia mobilis]